MKAYHGKHKIWIKTIAMAVVCLFLVNDIAWPNPGALQRENSDTLSRWLVTKALTDAGVDDHTKVELEAVTGIGFLAKGMEVQTVNSILTENAARAGIKPHTEFLSCERQEDDVTTARFCLAEDRAKIFEILRGKDGAIKIRSVSATLQAADTPPMAVQTGTSENGGALKANPLVVDAVKNSIRKNGGKITFYEYMKTCLYHPDGGYYSGGAVHIGGKIDRAHFNTFPVAMSPYFGEAIMAQLFQMWKNMGEPAEFTVVEMGAGTGVLARDILLAARKDAIFLKALKYIIVEISPALVEKQKETISKAEDGDELISKVQWLNKSAVETGLSNVEGVFLSNELPDAFPVHRVKLINGRPQEAYVAYDSEKMEFTEEWGDLSSPEISEYLNEVRYLYHNIELEEIIGQEEISVNPLMVKWYRNLAQSLKRGYVITIDYSNLASLRPSYYGFTRSILTYPDSGQKHPENLYLYPGGVDITSYIYFPVLHNISYDTGLITEGIIRQRDFLLNLGVPTHVLDQYTGGGAFFAFIQRKGIDAAPLDGLFGVQELPASGSIGQPAVSEGEEYGDAMGKIFDGEGNLLKSGVRGTVEKIRGVPCLILKDSRGNHVYDKYKNIITPLELETIPGFNLETVVEILIGHIEKSLETPWGGITDQEVVWIKGIIEFLRNLNRANKIYVLKNNAHNISGFSNRNFVCIQMPLFFASSDIDQSVRFKMSVIPAIFHEGGEGYFSLHPEEAAKLGMSPHEYLRGPGKKEKGLREQVGGLQQRLFRHDYQDKLTEDLGSHKESNHRLKVILQSAGINSIFIEGILKSFTKTLAPEKTAESIASAIPLIEHITNDNETAGSFLFHLANNPNAPEVVEAISKIIRAYEDAGISKADTYFFCVCLVDAPNPKEMSDYLINESNVVIKIMKLSRSIGREAEAYDVVEETIKYLITNPDAFSFREINGHEAEIIDLINAIGAKNVDVLFKNCLSSFKKSLGADKTKQCLPDLAQLAVDAGVHARALFKDGFPAAKELIKDKESLNRVGDSLVRLTVAAGAHAMALFQTNLALVIQHEDRLSELIENLAYWKDHGDNLEIILTIVERTKLESIKKAGFSTDKIEGLALEIINSKTVNYVNNFEDLFALSTIKNDEYRVFREFVMNSNIELRTRMNVAAEYAELIAIAELFGEYKESDKLSSDKLGMANSALIASLDNINAIIGAITTASTISRRSKLAASIASHMKPLKIAVMEYIIDRNLSDSERSLFDVPSISKEILTVLSIALTAELSESFTDGDSLREYIKNALITLFSNYVPGESGALDNAKVKTREWLINTEKNKATIDKLVKAGYDERLWTDGIEISIPVVKSITEERKLQMILQSAHDMVDIALALGVKYIDGETLTLDYAKHLNTYDKANSFYNSVKSSVSSIAEDTDESLIDILNFIQRTERIPVGGDEEAAFNVVIQKDIFREGTAGMNVPGCFNPRGIHREMPLVHAFEANAFFIQVFDTGGRQVANAVMVLGSVIGVTNGMALPDSGAFIYSGYNNSSYDMEIVYARALKELTKYAPVVIFDGRSAGITSLKPYLKKAKNVILTKPAVLFNDQYFDFGDVDDAGNLTIALESAFIMTRESVEDAGGFNDEVIRELPKDEEPRIKDKDWQRLASTLIEKGLKQYLPIIKELKFKYAQEESIVINSDFQDWLEERLARFRGDKEKAKSAILEFLSFTLPTIAISTQTTDAIEAGAVPVAINFERVEKLLFAENADEKRLLAKSAKYLVNTPVNEHIDISAIPGDGEEFKQNIKTLALLIARNNVFGLNIRYVLDSDPDGGALAALKSELEELAKMPGMNKEELLSRLGPPHAGNDVINIYLATIDNIKKIGQLADKECAVALKDDPELPGVSIPNYTAALTIGIALAALKAAKEKLEKGEYEDMRSKMFDAVSRIYRRFGIIKDDAEFTVNDFEFMVTGCSENKLKYAFIYALPPVVKAAIDTLKEYHMATQILLQSA